MQILRRKCGDWVEMLAIKKKSEEEKMSKTIVAVNAGPRKGWNTDTLITEAAKGAEAAGAAVKKFDLFKLEKYTGCISCFGCKKEKFRDAASARMG